MVAKKILLLAPMPAGGQWLLSHLHRFDPGREHLYLLNRWQGGPNS